MTKITRRKDGRYQAAITVEGKRRYFYGATSKECKEKLAKARLDLAQGRSIVTSKQTVKQFMERWFEDVHKSQVGERWYLSSKAVAANHLYPALGHIRLDKLNVQHIQALYTSLQQDGLAVTTIKQIHALLHKALDTAVKWELVRRNESDFVEMPHEDEPFEGYALSLEEANALIAAARPHSLDTLIQTTLATGLRRGEVCALHWTDIHWQKGYLRVERNVIEVPGKGHVEKSPKTKTSRRAVQLPPFLLDVLRKQQTHVKELRLAAGERWQEHDLVFPSEVGTHHWRATLHRRFKQCLTEAGLSEEIRFHDLRHSTGSFLLAKGVDLKVIQTILGHSTISVTGDVYAHVAQQLHEDAAAKMDELFGS